jgi:hypothetical protein
MYTAYAVEQLLPPGGEIEHLLVNVLYLVA